MVILVYSAAFWCIEVHKICYCTCNMFNVDIIWFKEVWKCLKYVKTEMCVSPYIITFLRSEKHPEFYLNFDRGGKALTKSEKSPPASVLLMKLWEKFSVDGVFCHVSLPLLFPLTPYINFLPFFQLDSISNHFLFSHIKSLRHISKFFIHKRLSCRMNFL